MTAFVRLLTVALIFANGYIAQVLTYTGGFGRSGDIDPNYQIIKPDGTTVSAIKMSPNAKWYVRKDFEGEWIGITKNGNLNLPKGNYIYVTTFGSKDFISLSGYFYADNRVTSVCAFDPPMKIGKPPKQCITSFTTGSNSYNGARTTFTINSFGKTNTLLAVQVVNDGSGGPSGLLMWFDAPVLPPSLRPTKAPHSPPSFRPTFTAIPTFTTKPTVTPKPTPTSYPTTKSFITDGLFAYYNARSFTKGDSIWKDLSGNGRDAVVNGTVNRGTGANNKAFISGGIHTSIKFPVAGLYKYSYTFLHRAKYNGPNQKRIFTSSPLNQCNFAFGFYEGYGREGFPTALGATGIAYQNNFITPPQDVGNGQAIFHDLFIPHTLAGSAWGISAHQTSHYRAASDSGPINFWSIDSLTGCNYPDGGGVFDRGPTQTRGFNLGINIWPDSYNPKDYGDKRSDWAVSEVFLYNRELSTDEMTYMQRYLAR